MDEAGRQWMRTAAFPVRWYLLGTGFDGSIWWDEPSYGSWRRRGAAAGFSFFLLPVVVQRQVLEWFSAELESLFMRHSTVASR